MTRKTSLKKSYRMRRKSDLRLPKTGLQLKLSPGFTFHCSPFTVHFSPFTFHLITANTSPLATLAPPVKGASTSTPSTGEGILLYIFIASRTRTVSPCLTGSPGFFSYLINIPGIGAVIFVPPSELTTGAGLGSGAGLEGFT